VGRLRERPRRRWEDVIQMDLQELGLGNIDSNEMAHDRKGEGHV
jgi:hypothetical protein